MHASRNARHGFSLLEIAVVMGVIGLLLGGIIVGKNMIANQQLRKIGTEATTYMLAMNQFKQKYGFLPGDFPAATTVWGRADGGTPIDSNCAAPNTTASVGATTCNGDGDGMITNIEGFRAWQHLQAAGLITGKYTGIYVTNSSALIFISPPGMMVSFPTNDATPGTNTPIGPLPKSTYVIRSYSTFLTMWGGFVIPAFFYSANYNNSLAFTASGTVGIGSANAIISGVDALNIDTKLDDGLPASGMILAGAESTCATPGGTYIAYDVATQGAICGLVFLKGFAGMANASQ